jgi:hypothetical protein
VAESLPEKQVRLLLEEQCSRAFGRLLVDYRPSCEITLIAFDFGGGPGVPYSNVAYKSTLPLRAIIRTLEDRLERWAQPNPPRLLHDPKLHGWLPDAGELERMAAALRSLFGQGVGFSLFCGQGQRVQYVSSGEREGVAAMLRDDLLPGLRGDVLQSGGALG